VLALCRSGHGRRIIEVRRISPAPRRSTSPASVTDLDRSVDSAACENFVGAVGVSPDIDRCDNTLGAERSATCRIRSGSSNHRGIDGDFVRADRSSAVRFHGSTRTDGERHETFVSNVITVQKSRRPDRWVAGDARNTKSSTSRIIVDLHGLHTLRLGANCRSAPLETHVLERSVGMIRT